MPRPTTKKDLLALSEENLRKLFSFIESIPESMREKEYPLNERDKNIRDVLCHLHEWHLMVNRWYEEGRNGGSPAVPGEGYTWKTLPALNRVIWEKYQRVSLTDANALLRESHAETTRLIERLSDEQLFTLKMYPWTKTTTLGAYFVSATSSHYDWALKTLKVIKKYF